MCWVLIRTRTSFVCPCFCPDSPYELANRLPPWGGKGGKPCSADQKTYIVTNFVATFFVADDAPIINAATQRFVDVANNYTKSVGHFVPFIYMNYALPSQQGAFFFPLVPSISRIFARGFIHKKKPHIDPDTLVLFLTPRMIVDLADRFGVGGGGTVIESYGPENVKFLQAVSRKYDPDHVFQRLVPGGFKLPG